MSRSPKNTGNPLLDLLRAVAELSSAVTSGVIGRPTAPGPVVDIRHGKGHDPRPRR